MKELEAILRLLEVRASHYWGSAFTYSQVHFPEDFEGTPSALAREELYDAKCEALRDFIEEIRGAIIPGASMEISEAPRRDTRYVFITEMAGTMTATIMNTRAELDDADTRFERDHAEYFKEHQNAKSAWNLVEIGDRDVDGRQDAPFTGVLDVRFVLITEIAGEMHAIICDTEKEVKREAAEFELEFGDRIARHEAVWAWHEILIPPRLVGSDQC